jgi:hypothetical protein
MDDHDVVIDAVRAELRALPEVNPDARARLLIAVAAERQRERDAMARRRIAGLQLRWVASGALAAAALMTVLFLRPRPGTAPVAPVGTATVSPAHGVSQSAQLAANDPAALEMAPQPVQFVFRAPDAASVHVVGDFNTWEKAPMVRDSASGLWSATLMVRPGRHVYAFVVDDSVWKRDPRAASAPDADFGRPGSVLLVGRPAPQGNR